MSKSRVLDAHIKVRYDTDDDWWILWRGNALDLHSMKRVIDIVERDGGKAWVVIPATSRFYTFNNYRRLPWVNAGLREMG